MGLHSLVTGTEIESKDRPVDSTLVWIVTVLSAVALVGLAVSMWKRTQKPRDALYCYERGFVVAPVGSAYTVLPYDSSLMEKRSHGGGIPSYVARTPRQPEWTELPMVSRINHIGPELMRRAESANGSRRADPGDEGRRA